MENRYDDEVEYWRSVFNAVRESGPDSEAHAKYRYLLDPNAELDPALAGELFPDRDEQTVLDVGCGPLTVLGKRAGTRRLRITGVDPLADQYKAMLSEIDFVQPFECRSGFGEEVDRYFQHDQFDFVHSRNALDHSQDPAKAIRAMIHVAKPGAAIWINVNRNEGINASYNGLHSWNFDALYDTIVLWNPGRSILFEEIVDGMPFKWAVKVGDANKTCPQEIDIVVYKDPVRLKDLTACHDGIFAGVTGRNSFFTVWCPSDLDERYNFFIHGYDRAGQMVFNRSYRWYNNLRRRSIHVPNLPEIGHFQIGQFDVHFVDGKPIYDNRWTGYVSSSND